jgi:hypothetical protein
MMKTSDFQRPAKVRKERHNITGEVSSAYLEGAMKIDAYQ